MEARRIALRQQASELKRQAAARVRDALTSTSGAPGGTSSTRGLRPGRRFWRGTMQLRRTSFGSWSSSRWRNDSRHATPSSVSKQPSGGRPMRANGRRGARGAAWSSSDERRRTRCVRPSWQRARDEPKRAPRRSGAREAPCVMQRAASSRRSGSCSRPARRPRRPRQVLHTVTRHNDACCEVPALVPVPVLVLVPVPVPVRPWDVRPRHDRMWIAHELQ